MNPVQKQFPTGLTHDQPSHTTIEDCDSDLETRDEVIGTFRELVKTRSILATWKNGSVHHPFVKTFSMTWPWAKYAGHALWAGLMLPIFSMGLCFERSFGSTSGTSAWMDRSFTI